MKTPVLLIGGGVAGMAAALEIARGDSRVILVEAEAHLGGSAAHYSCKATDSCQRCGACQSQLLAEAVKNCRGIELLLGWRVSVVKPLSGQIGFLVRITRGTQVDEIEAQVVIAATGFTPYDAHDWGEYGYGRYPGVITSLDLEREWRDVSSLNELYPGLKNIAFIQCVGSRTTRSGGNQFCSRVCCANTLRNLVKLRWEQPDIEMSVFHMDLQWSGTDLNIVSQLSGVNLVRSIPSLIYQLPGKRVTVKWEPPAGGEYLKEFDLVVLAVGMNSSQESLEMEQLSGCRGFFGAGAVVTAMDIRESIAQGVQIGIKVRRLLKSSKQAAGLG